MYQERHSKFTFKDVFLKLLFIVLVAFVVVGFFPTKSYVENLINSRTLNSENSVFNDNVQTMREAGLSYYNGSRLPSKSSKLSLKEMLNKKLLVELVDNNGKTCNINKSYVKVTKNSDDDYKMEVNLVCDKKKGKIISYFSAYSYCDSGICEKKKLIKESTETSSETASETPSETSAKKIETTASTSECEYVKTSNGYYNYSNWSSWSTTFVSSSSTREVQTKVDKVKVGTVVEQSGTKKITQNPKKVTGTKNGKKFIVYICPSDFDNGGSYNNFVTCVKTTANYVTKDTYKNITYYRYRNKNYINGNSTYKWSNCNDTSLINQGYNKTNNVR